jgi:hypothetical protein
LASAYLSLIFAQGPINTMNKEVIPQESEVVFYTTQGGIVHIEVFFQNEKFVNYSKINYSKNLGRSKRRE